jgi:hypothetical protein
MKTPLNGTPTGVAAMITDTKASPAVMAVLDRIAATLAGAVAELPQPEPAPEGYLPDAQGRLVPIAQVRESDLLRDQVAGDLAIEAALLQVLLRSFKRRALADLADLVSTAAQRFGVQIGGGKGNLSVTTYDGAWKVQRVYRNVLTFSEEIHAAKALIDECITRWSEGADANIRVLVDRAFRTDKSGDLRTGPVLELLRVEIDDPEWKRAMRALTESIHVSGSAVYVRVFRRLDSGTYVPVPLDLAAV